MTSDDAPSDQFPHIILHPAERVRLPVGRPERFLRIKEDGIAERSPLGRKPVVHFINPDGGAE